VAAEAKTLARSAVWADLTKRLDQDLATASSPVLRQRDEEAWMELSRRLRSCALHAGLTGMGGLSEVDDIVQATLLKLQSREALQFLRAARSPEGYVVGIMRNLARDSLRRSAPYSRTAVRLFRLKQRLGRSLGLPGATPPGGIRTTDVKHRAAESSTS
jgi:DNA-directed RNA polymerase specialized sigma24 family protein